MNDKITRGSTWSICFKFKSELMAVYNYLHEKHIDEAAEIKAMQAMFK